MFLFVVVSFLREIQAIDVTLESIYKFFNAAEKHLVIDGKYKNQGKVDWSNLIKNCIL